MDGPKVNWKFYNDLEKDIHSNHDVKLLNVGSCGLHKVHGCFKTAFEQSGWKMDSSLKSIYSLFHNSPTRREDYTKHTASDTFPEHFCNTRWLENGPCAQRALDILPHVMSYVKNYSLPQSVSGIKKFLDDDLFSAKLAFFVSLSKEVEKFLKDYQTDRPMMPFMYTDLNHLTISLLSRFFTQDAIKKLKRTTDFLKLDVTTEEFHVPIEKIKLGFVAMSKLKELKTRDEISDSQILEFRQQCKEILVDFTRLFLEKSPLQFTLAKNASCLDPQLLVKNKALCVNKMECILRSFVNKRGLKDIECDLILKEFSSFIDSAVVSGSLSSFDKHKDRLDTFYYDCLSGKREYKKLWPIVQDILLLSHGQASVERGFSINKEMENPSLNQRTLIAKRHIVDFIRSKGGLDKVSITQQLLQYASQAYSHYNAYLDGEKEKQKSSEAGKKRKAAEEEIRELKKKRSNIIADISALNKSIEEYSDRAEKERSFSLLCQANGLRQKMKTKEEEECKIKNEIEEKLSNLKSTDQ